MTVAQEISAPSAVLFDFGGVLTSSVAEGFSQFSEDIGGSRNLVLSLLSTDGPVVSALVAHEEGRMADVEFERQLAAALAEAGVTVEPVGLISRMQQYLTPDLAMIALVSELRTLGVAVGLVSNSLGRDCYAGFDLEAIFDAVTISGREGVRKPSRRIYEIACARLNVSPTHTIMIDDFAHNVFAGQRLGMRGIVHRQAQSTRRELGHILGLELPIEAAKRRPSGMHLTVLSGSTEYDLSASSGPPTVAASARTVDDPTAENPSVATIEAATIGDRFEVDAV